MGDHAKILCESGRNHRGGQAGTRGKAASRESALDATYALARGAELTAVRDNLRHASISTTSVYLHSDEVKRAKQIREAFAAR
jgi:integrase